MKYKSIFGILILVFLAGTVSAVNADLKFDVSITGKDTFGAEAARGFTDVNIQFMGGYLSDESTRTAFTVPAVQTNFTIEIVVDGVSIGSTDFVFMADRGYTVKVLDINYTSGMNNLKILYKGREKLSVNLSSLLCDNNGKCENCLVEGKTCLNHFESALSCSSDCNASTSTARTGTIGAMNTNQSNPALQADSSSKVRIISYTLFFVFAVISVVLIIFITLKVSKMVKQKNVSEDSEKTA